MGLRRYLEDLLHHASDTKHLLEEERQKLDGLYYSMMNVVFQQRVDCLREKTLNSAESGISDEKYCDHEVVVSLTTFGKRIYDVYLAIESIMQGTMKPNRIVLWLSDKEFKGKPLPITLQKQQKRGLEVRFCEDVRSYTKLIPALKQFPDACIITIDDDAMYEYDIIERLVNSHIENPGTVCACRIHKVKLDENQMPLSYLEWEHETMHGDTGSPLLFPTGVGGVIYPPHCFSEEVLNKEVFLSICQYADDVWFYAMELLDNVPVAQTYTGVPCYYMNLPSSQLDPLSKENVDETSCRNDVQIKAVFEKYHLNLKFQNS